MCVCVCVCVCVLSGTAYFLHNNLKCMPQNNAFELVTGQMETDRFVNICLLESFQSHDVLVKNTLLIHNSRQEHVSIQNY